MIEDKKKQKKEKKELKDKNAYDLSLKDALEGIEGAVTEMFLGFKTKEVSDASVELIKIEEKRADYVCQITDENDKKHILHIEFQSTNHFSMHFRMLRYLTELYKKYKLPIIQLVIYIGKDKLNMKNKIEFKAHNTEINYQYQLVDMSSLSCESFLNSNSGGLISLAILCNYEIYGKEALVRKIREKLEIECKGDYNWLRNQFYRVEILSNLRKDMFEIVKKEEEMLANRIRVEDLPSYHIGMERGEQRGIQKGFKRGIQQEREHGLRLIKQKQQQFQEKQNQSLKIRKNELIEGIWLLVKLKFDISKKDFYPLLEKIQGITKLKEIRTAVLKIDNIKDIEALIKNDKKDS